MRYSNGGVELVDVDLTLPNGDFFGMERSYTNQASSDYDGPAGFNWFVRQMPYAVADGTSVAIVIDPSNPYWFDLVSGVYTPRYGTVGVTLGHDVTAQTFTFVLTINAEMDVTIFNDFTTTTAPGGLVSNTDFRGVMSSVTSRTGNQINQIARSYSIAGVTTTELLDYAYNTSGSAVGKLQTVTFSRQVGGASPTQIVQAAFTYYGSSDTQGSLNDLQSATQQVPNGTGGWNNVATTWYRYWMSGSSTGFAHALKMRFGPEACRLMFNASISVSTASDSTVQTYADQYFEYDPTTRRVTKEIASARADSDANGTTGDTFAYSANVNTPPTSPPDYNWWAVKTTQTLPDSSQIVAYTNFCGMPMLYVSVDSAGTSKWPTFYRYDSNGRLIWEAEASAINLPSWTTLESFNDLLHFNSGTGLYQYLNNSSGLIYETYYYATTNTSLGQVAGYVSDLGLRQGQSGTTVYTQSFTYLSHADTPGRTVYPLGSRIDYPIAGNTTTQIASSFAYTWYTGVNIASQKTTTLPVATSGQNGSGIAATIIEQFDVYGNRTQVTDERSIVSTFTNDIVLGVVTEQVLNYQSGVTQPGVNVTSDLTYDALGRLTQKLGPSHTTVISGTATTVRHATWNLLVQSTQPMSGTWGPDENRTGEGYATGTGPSYSYLLVNPVTLARLDKDGRTIDQISSNRTTGSGALSPTDTFAQSDWQAWTNFTYTTQHRLTSSQLYFLIPSSGAGTSGTNFAQTLFGYDAVGRQNRVVAPGGTTFRTVFNTVGWTVSAWVGTNDTGATDSNPAGSGSPNNMVVVTANQYDGGSAGGDGNLTQVTQYAAASDTRVTSYAYDFRDRLVSATGEVNSFSAYTYDNLDELTQTDRRDTNSAGNLIGQETTAFNNLGVVYQQSTYAVDPSTGTVGNALTTNNFYDLAGNLIMQINAGDGPVFTKYAYNGVGWMTDTYRGYNLSGSGYSEATSLASDTIVEQTSNTFDEAGNIVSQVSYQRLNDATGTGALTVGTQPKGRASYSANWFDGVDRLSASGNYGAATTFTRPSTPPASSATVLVTATTYTDAAWVYQVTDPRGLIQQTTYDNTGRVTKIVEAVSGSVADDLNRTTQFTFTLDGLIATQVATNGVTGNQTTTYTYGTSISTSGVARNDLLASITYPDSVSGSDVVAYTYNRQSQSLTTTDQRGAVRTFLYDKLGRLTDDCVTTLGTGTDGAVRRISTAYEIRGLPSTVTSYDNAAPGSGTVLNQVANTYNTFSQLTKEQQDHAGTVSGTSPNVQYAYASGGSGANQIRPTNVTYPNGRVIATKHGTTGSMEDALSRISAIQDGTTNLAQYTYLGASSVIRVDYVSEPVVWLDLWGGTSGTFSGLDLFNRVIDQRWRYHGGTPADLDRYQYGYDGNSNRLWRANLMTTSKDEFYILDHLNRISEMERGSLNGTKTGIFGTPVRDLVYTLDPTGNWPTYVTYISGTTDLSQTRTHSTVNAIATISGTPTWAAPSYDPAGNETSLPQPATLTSSYAATYDAWNRLVQLTAGGITVAQYKFDGVGRRIVKLTYTSGVLSETRHFYFTSAAQDIEQRVGTSTSIDRQSVWGIRYVDDLICRDDSSAARLYAMQDANFNLTAICNTSGVVQERYQFDPYGVRTIMNAAWTIQSSSAFAWNIGHQGLLHDVESGLIYNRRRMLHPNLGRFLQRDPIGYAAGLNLYEYERGNPVRYLDPIGLDPLSLNLMGLHV